MGGTIRRWAAEELPEEGKTPVCIRWLARKNNAANDGVTGSLHVDFLKPTAIDAELVIRGRVKEIKGRGRRA